MLLLVTAKIENLKAIHNIVATVVVHGKLLVTAKIENLKAIHNTV